VDDLGKTASASTTLTILPPPPTRRRDLCAGISFTRDRKRPVRVDNEAKGCLDDIALSPQRAVGCQLVIVAHSDAADKPYAAAQRAVNTTQYLIYEKGIDPPRIELRTGIATGRTVAAILVPAGAAFSDDGTTLVDEAALNLRFCPRKQRGNKMGSSQFPNRERSDGRAAFKKAAWGELRYSAKPRDIVFVFQI
jgi:hypothetical protein